MGFRIDNPLEGVEVVAVHDLTVHQLLVADAQTSGGLLIAVPPDLEPSLIIELERNHAPARAGIGELVPGEPGSIEVTAE